MYLCLTSLSSLLVVCPTCNHTRNSTEHPTTARMEVMIRFFRVVDRLPPHCLGVLRLHNSNGHYLGVNVG